ncbi:MAG: hypothetical protein RJA70_1813 [Pseudomonadota bacterium]|jgi:DNA-binding CsgD family transcriptional regulator
MDQVTLKLLDVLGSSLDLSTVLREAYPLLSRLVAADYGAVGVSSSGRAANFEWTVAHLPPAFFDAYPEVAAHDFVRAAVATAVEVVICDQTMVSRSQVEQNMMYGRAREVGAPIEQVMAVMLEVDERWQSGLSLHRDRRRPFSEVERARLQRVTPALKNAVRNCHLFGVANDWKHALEKLLTSSSSAILLLTFDGREVARSDATTRLLDHWFPGEYQASRLPPKLIAAFEAIRRKGGDSPRFMLPGTALQVSFSAMTAYAGAARWLLHFEEQSLGVAFPGHWRRKLTARQQEVTSCVLQGWDNRLIASELGCANATVKKHLQSVYDSLGVGTRAALIVQAAQALDH